LLLSEVGKNECLKTKSAFVAKIFYEVEFVKTNQKYHTGTY